MSDIWAACADEACIRELSGTLLRMVESQEQVATLNLVDSLAEQAVLESLIESAKPPLPEGARNLHWLLATPFRYPPLPHGSRFGRRHEPALFYAALSRETLLHECAYYRFVFRTGMAEPPPALLHSQHTLFQARYGSAQGVQLHKPPFDAFGDALRSPIDYGPTQALGQAMRRAGVVLFEYASARDPAGGTNVALFAPEGLRSRRPTRQQAWLCETGDEQVSFWAKGEDRAWQFPRALFEIDGRLPRPAA